MFLKELMLIKQVHQKILMFVTIGKFLNKGCKFEPHVCNRCHDLLMMSMKLSDIAILNIKGSDHCCTISRISKSEAIKLFQNIDLTEKVGHYKKMENYK